MHGKPCFCQVKEVQVFNYVCGHFQYTATLRKTSVLFIGFTIHLACSLLRLKYLILSIMYIQLAPNCEMTDICMHVCVCVSAPWAMKIYSREVKPEQPIKQVLLLFSLFISHLLSI